jgi:hypothetical protein
MFSGSIWNVASICQAVLALMFFTYLPERQL